MELLEQIESYLADNRVPASTFGRTVLGDPRFVDDLRLGRRPRRKTQERVRFYLNENGWAHFNMAPADSGPEAAHL